MKTSANVSGIAGVLCIVTIAIGTVATMVAGRNLPIAIAVPIGLYLLFSIKVADQWERAAVLRLGKYTGMRGPGNLLGLAPTTFW